MKKKINWKIWKVSVVAAGLALVLIVPAAAYAIETVQHNTTVEYLTSLDIDVMDLSNYSKGEVIEVVETYDAYENSEIIENRLPDSSSSVLPQEPTNITSEQIGQLTPGMTVKDIKALLGETQDIGSGIYILCYKVDNAYMLTIPLAGDNVQLGVYGEDLLKALQPIEMIEGIGWNIEEIN